MRRLVVTAPLALAACLTCSVARADATSEAREAYDQGARAYDAKDYALATTSFARADEKVANGRALELAMASALLGGDATLGMDLVVRAERRSVDGTLASLAASLRKRFAGGVGSVSLVCAKGHSCSGSLEGRALTPGLPRHAAPGVHKVEITSDDGATTNVVVTVERGADTLATEARANPPSALTPPPPPARGEPPRPQSGLSPVYFGVAAGLTTLGVGTALGLTIRTSDLHEDFRAAPSRATSDAGNAAQTSARIVWGVSFVLTAATVALFVLTDFHGRDRGALAIGPGHVVVTGRF